jgi:CheY-like chemotaxis protein
MSGKLNVLVICQTAAGQMYLGVLLKRIWYKSILAKTVEEGIHYAGENPFSLIVFDADMPDQDRESAVSLLRSDPSVKDLPLVVFLTSEKGKSSESLLARGCAAVITKPLDMALVYNVLARLSGQERQAPRVPTRIRVEIEEKTPEKYLTCINISEGGMYLRTIDPLPEKGILHQKFILPRDTSEIEATAEVIRTESLGIQIETEPGMALRFTEISEEDRLRIRNYIQWELTGDLDWKATI